MSCGGESRYKKGTFSAITRCTRCCFSTQHRRGKGATEHRADEPGWGHSSARTAADFGSAQRRILVFFALYFYITFSGAIAERPPVPSTSGTECKTRLSCKASAGGCSFHPVTITGVCLCRCGLSSTFSAQSCSRLRRGRTFPGSMRRNRAKCNGPAFDKKT